MALNLEVSNKAPALPIKLTQDLMDAFEIISNVFGGSVLRQASMKTMQCLPLAWACLALKEAGKKVKDVRDREASRCYQEVALPGFIKLCHEAIEESDGALRFPAGCETELTPPSEVRDACKVGVDDGLLLTGPPPLSSPFAILLFGRVRSLYT